MEIIKDLRPKNRKYKFIHPGCCEFIANGDEFRWTTGQYNERVADVICPQCGKQFYDIPEELKENGQFTGWYPTTNCMRNCKACRAKCIFRKEEYNDFVSPKD
jgi:hypothetical protein